VKHKKYTEEFKKNAVAMLNANGGEGAASVAAKLKIAPSMLYSWRKKAAKGYQKPEAKKATGSASAHKDAIVYLRHAREDVNARLRGGTLKKMDKAHLLLLLALNVLGGDQ
jgi:transposase-like protein